MKQLLSYLYFFTKAFGILGGVKLSYHAFIKNTKKEITEEDRKKTIKLRVKKYGFNVVIRPYDSDLALMETMFCYAENGHLQYDNELPQLKHTPQYFLDGGANIGLFSLIYQQKYPKAEIIAVEPDRGNYDLLVRNTSYTDKIYCVNKGLWSNNTWLRIVDAGAGSWDYMVQETDEDHGEVRATTVTSLMSQYHFSRIDVLKLDIEGSEKELFTTGADEWLPEVGIIIIELHEDIVPGVSRIVYEKLEKYGFEEIEQISEDKIFANKSALQ